MVHDLPAKGWLEYGLVRRRAGTRKREAPLAPVRVGGYDGADVPEMDTLTPAARSRLMSLIRGKDTQPGRGVEIVWECETREPGQVAKRLIAFLGRG